MLIAKWYSSHKDHNLLPMPRSFLAFLATAISQQQQQPANATKKNMSPYVQISSLLVTKSLICTRARPLKLLPSSSTPRTYHYAPFTTLSRYPSKNPVSVGLNELPLLLRCGVSAAARLLTRDLSDGLPVSEFPAWKAG